MSEEAPVPGANAAEDKSVQIAGTQFLKTLELPSTLCTRSNSIQSMVSVNGGEHIWACCNEGSMLVWDAKTGQVLGTRQAHKATIFDLLCVSNAHNPFANEKNTVWAACMDSSVTIWNTSLCLLRRLTLGASSATSLAQVGHNVYIADARHIHIFDSQTYALRAVVELPRLTYLSTAPSTASVPSDPPAHDPPSALMRSVPSVANLNRLAILPSTRSPPMAESDSARFNGYFVRTISQVKQYAWVSTDGFVCFLDSTTKSFVPGVYIDIPKINSIIYIESTNQVWGACSDSCIYVWDADAPSQIGKIQPLKCLSGWTSDRVSKLVNYQDSLIYAAAWDKKMRIWDAKTMELLHTSTRAHECPMMGLVVLPYPWFKIYPQSSKTVSPSPPMSPGAPPTKEISTERRVAQSLPVQSSTSSSGEVSLKSSVAISSDSVGLGEPQEITILTVFTADWSSVSQWI